MSTADKPERIGYVLGTHDEELQRLGLQHSLWREQAEALWDLAGIRPGMTVLDVGCGPGFATLDLARRVGPTGHVIAVDESQRYLDHLKAQADAAGLANIETRHGDAQNLPVTPNCADAAYARWVLCFVPKPEAVLSGVVTALRAGGVFAIQDYYFYRAMRLCPPSDAFNRTILAVHDSWVQRGGDSDIGSRLPSMLAPAGFNVAHLRALVRMARPHEPLWQWPFTFFRNFLPMLVEMGLLTQAEHDAFNADWKARESDPGGFFATPPMIDIVATKSGR